MNSRLPLSNKRLLRKLLVKLRPIVIAAFLPVVTVLLPALSRMFQIDSFFDQVHPQSRVVTTRSAATTATATTATTSTATTTATTTTPTPTVAISTTPATIFDKTTTKRPTILSASRYTNIAPVNRSSWKPAQQVSFKLDKNFNQLIRQLHHTTRLSHSVPHTSSHHYNTNPNHPVLRRTITPYRPSYSGLVTERSYREGFPSTSATGSGILQLNVRHPKEKWRSTASIQPQEIEPILGCSPFQNGNNSRSISHGESQRLPCLHRPVRRIPTCRPPSQLTQIPTTKMENSGISILHDRIRIILQSICLHQSLQTNLGTLPFSGIQNISLSRRLDFGSKFQRISNATSPTGSGSLTTSRLDRQCQEISSASYATIGTSGLYIEHPDDDRISTSEKTERYSSINQTSLGQTTSTISSGNSQFDYAYSSSNFCNFPGTTVHSPSVILQEPNGKERTGLGPSSFIGPSQPRRTELVVSELTEMERSISPTYDTHTDYLCGRKRYGMGLQLENPPRPWILDHTGSSPIHQLEGTQGGPSSTDDFPSTSKFDDFDTNGQYDQSFLHQQARRYSLSSFNGTGYRSLELVPGQQYTYPSTTYSWNSQQHCGHGITSNFFQEPMAIETEGFPNDQPLVGPPFNRPLRRQDHQVTTKVRILDAGPGRYPHGCIHHSMEYLDETFRKSTLESHLTGFTEDNSGTDPADNNSSTSLAQRNLVSLTPTPSVRSSPIIDSTGDPDDFSEDSSSLTTPELDTLRMEIIRTKLVNANINEQATQDILDHKFAPTLTNKAYRKNQLRFIDWAYKNQVSFTDFSGADMVNFLATMRQEHTLQVSTLKTLRTAATHLHTNSNSITVDDLVNNYLDSLIKQEPPVSIHREPVDMTPSLAYARTILSRSTTSLKSLQQKLAFLLSMAAFLRPSDLARIPFSSCNIRPDGSLTFQVVAPKETRKKRRIIKSFTVHPHNTDIELCPVRCFSALRDHSSLASRSVDSHLFVKSHIPSQPLSSSTLSSWLHREFISLSTSESRVTMRSLASSRALDQGVSIDNIVSLGNWASSSTFQDHYRRNQMATVDFTSTVLSGSFEDEFFDASDTLD